VDSIILPEELKHRIEQFPEVDWSAIAMDAISERLQRLALNQVFDNLLENSELSEEDALRLSEEVKEAGLQELKDKGLV